MPYFVMPDGRQISYRGKGPLTADQYATLVRIVEAVEAEVARQRKEEAMADDAGAATPHPIYTWGYVGNALADLRGWVAALGATVVDVRQVPWSQRPEWQGPALKAAFGPQYGQIKAFGNRNYRAPESGAAAPPAVRADALLWAAYQAHGFLLADPARGLARLRPVWERGPVILLCGCGAPDGCHRSLVAAYLAREFGAPVAHLPGRYAVCQACQAPLVWARHRLSNKPAPLNALPSAAGNLVLEANGNYAVLPEAERAGRTDLYTSHYADCPKAAHFGERAAAVMTGRAE